MPYREENESIQYEFKELIYEINFYRQDYCISLRTFDPETWNKTVVKFNEESTEVEVKMNFLRGYKALKVLGKSYNEISLVFLYDGLSHLMNLTFIKNESLDINLIHEISRIILTPCRSLSKKHRNLLDRIILIPVNLINENHIQALIKSLSILSNSIQCECQLCFDGVSYLLLNILTVFSFENSLAIIYAKKDLSFFSTIIIFYNRHFTNLGQTDVTGDRYSIQSILKLLDCLNAEKIYNEHTRLLYSLCRFFESNLDLFFNIYKINDYHNLLSVLLDKSTRLLEEFLGLEINNKKSYRYNITESCLIAVGYIFACFFVIPNDSMKMRLRRIFKTLTHIGIIRIKPLFVDRFVRKYTLYCYYYNEDWSIIIHSRLMFLEAFMRSSKYIYSKEIIHTIFSRMSASFYLLGQLDSGRKQNVEITTTFGLCFVLYILSEISKYNGLFLYQTRNTMFQLKTSVRIILDKYSSNKPILYYAIILYWFSALLVYNIEPKIFFNQDLNLNIIVNCYLALYKKADDIQNLDFLSNHPDDLENSKKLSNYILKFYDTLVKFNLFKQAERTILIDIIKKNIIYFSL